ncbi:MAG: ABC transporter permease [Lachnospiraceae bacterium]
MTVFKGFLTITKRNLKMVFLYIIIFLTISIMTQKMLGPQGGISFERESLDIAVIDRDGGALAKGLTEYLSAYHNIKDMPDDKSILQDRLFYREIYYIVTIPEDFENKVLLGTDTLPVTKVPGSTSGYYVDQQINTFINSVRVMTDGGFSLTDAIAKVQENSKESPQVTLIDKNGHGGSMPAHAFMYQYMPYIIISILCYTLGYIMIEFNKTDVRKRMRCSAVSDRAFNSQIFLGYVVVGFAVWCILSIMPIFVYRNDFLTDTNLPFYLLNSFILTIVALTLAFFVGSFLKSEELISAVVNVLSLGMSFLCGVFVSMDVLGKGVLTVAHFLPVYWYEIVNNLLAGNKVLSSSQMTELYQGLGIQLLFAAALLGAALVLRKNRAQAEG